VGIKRIEVLKNYNQLKEFSNNYLGLKGGFL
jgi:hypothetical protein